MAIFVSLAILILLSIFGLSILTFLQRNNPSRKPNLFISPSLGLAILTLLLYIFSALGLPLRQYYVVICLLLASFVIFSIIQNPSSIKEIIRFLAHIPLVFAASIFAWWPMLKYGFNWLSYANDDMFNYVLGSQRLQDFGLFAKPNTNFYLGKDYSQSIYSLHVIGGIRPGSELNLAFFSTLFHINSLQIFMPLIISLCVILNMSIMSLIANRTQLSKFKELVLLVILSTASMLNLPVYYQLIAQVGGICILVAFLVFTERHDESTSGFVLGLSITFIALILFYTEMIPFAIAIASIYLLRALQNREIELSKILKVAFVVFLFAISILNSRVVGVVKFLFAQIQSGSEGSNDRDFLLFPYFLKATAGSSLLGILPINVVTSTLTSIALAALGVYLMLQYIFFTLHSRNFGIIEIAVLIFLTVFVFFFIKKSDFATFKTAMYLHPFLAANVLLLILRYRQSFTSQIWKRSLLLFSCLIVFLGNAQATFAYAQISTGESKSSGLVELKQGSSQELVRDLSLIRNQYSSRMGTIISTTSSPSIAKLEMIELRGIPIIFPSMDFIGNFTSPLKLNAKSRNRLFASKSLDAPIFFYDRTLKFPYERNIVFKQSNLNVNESQYYLNYNNENAPGYQLPGVIQKSFTLSNDPLSSLLFVSSKEGPSYYMSFKNTAIFQPERHVFQPKLAMFGVANLLLFEVMPNIQEGDFYLTVDSTLLPQQDRTLPRLRLFGQNVYMADYSAMGLARIAFVGARPLKTDDGKRFFLLEISNTPKRFPTIAPQLWQKINRMIPADGREIGLHLLNVDFVDRSSHSAHSKDPYPDFFANSFRPSEYSGVFSDGWSTSDLRFSLNLQNGGKHRLEIVFDKNSIQKLKTYEMSYSINGLKPVKSDIDKSHNTLEIPISNLNQAQIQIFSPTRKLGYGDGRNVGLKILSIYMKK